jgi:hypothetical protein
MRIGQGADAVGASFAVTERYYRVWTEAREYPPFGVAPPFEISLNGGSQIRPIWRQLT